MCLNENFHTVDLPAWARWIAMDEDGIWWCYEAEPHPHDRGWYENEVGKSQKISVIVAGESDWKQSLFQVKST